MIHDASLSVNTKVLTADLKYVSLGRVRVGDKVVSFEVQPEGRGRRYRTGTVQRINHQYQNALKVTLESGKVFLASPDHLWLVKTGSNYFWRSTKSLRAGTRIPKVLPEFEEVDSREAGWLAGIYDGEGSLCLLQTSSGPTIQLSVSQKEGSVLAKIKVLLSSIAEVTGWTETDSGGDVWNLRVHGGTAKIAEILGRLRPGRLIEKFRPEYLGRIKTPDSNLDTVAEIEDVGKVLMAHVQIDVGSLIAEGYPHCDSKSLCVGS
jgi:hypothetical protein